MQLKATIVFVLSSFFSTVLLAGTADVNLDKLLGDIQTLEANFVQTSSIGDDKSGMLLLKKPSRFKLHVQKPIFDEQIIVSDGEKFYSYNVDFNQVVIRPQSESPLTAVVSGTPIGRTFQVSETVLKSGAREFSLKAKAGGAELPSVKLLFSKNGGLTRISFVEPSGSEVKIDLSKTKLNKHLADKQFYFEIPENVDDVIGL